MLSKIATIAIFSATVFAAPAPAASTSAPWKFSVTDFTTVCSAATCRYNFNVSGNAGPNSAPSFTAKNCGGQYPDDKDFHACGSLGIDLPGDVQILEQGVKEPGNSIVFVKLNWKKDGIAYSTTANSTVKNTGSSGQPKSFDMIPWQLTAVTDVDWPAQN